MRLSILNQVRRSPGASASSALRESIELAQLAEELGYERYWVAEHHGSPDTVCPAPEVLLAAIGAETSRIRIGAGGILLPHYSPLKVAECFRMLERLYPNRIDLGIGRSAGAGNREVDALQRHRVNRPFAEDFDEQLAELLRFVGGTFPDDHPFKDIVVSPGDCQPIPVWLLGSSQRSAATAAALELPYAFAQFICPPLMEEACRTYRAACKGGCQSGRAIVALSAVCVETAAGLGRLATAAATRNELPRRAATAVVPRRAPGREWEKGRFIGTPDTVRSQLSAVAAAGCVDEVMVLAPIGDHATCMRSYRLLAEAFDLPLQTTAGLAGESPLTVEETPA